MHATSRHERIAEEYIDYITSPASPNALRLDDIEKATLNDATLQAVTIGRQSGWHQAAQFPGADNQKFHAFLKVRQEQLTIGSTHRILLKGTKIVIPESLQT